MDILLTVDIPLRNEVRIRAHSDFSRKSYKIIVKCGLATIELTYAFGHQLRITN